MKTDSQERRNFIGRWNPEYPVTVICYVCAYIKNSREDIAKNVEYLTDTICPEERPCHHHKHERPQDSHSPH